jgi:hypothetical protein
MSTEILIDHTGLHSFHKKPIDQVNLGLKARELLQLIELLLLSDVVWISNLEQGECWNISESIVNLFSEFDLADARGESLIRFAHFSDLQHQKCIEGAAPWIMDTVKNMSANDLRQCTETIGYSLKPTGVQQVQIPSMAKIDYDSDEAKMFGVILKSGVWGGSGVGRKGVSCWIIETY